MSPVAVAVDAVDPSRAKALDSRPSAGPNGRSLQRILDGALAALSRRGATQLSMTDVCDAAGISRATLYRYFSNKEDLLAAVGEHVSRNFIDGLKAAIARGDVPIERLRRVLEFFIGYTAQVRTDRMLEIEPAFVLQFLQSHFVQHVAAFNEALSPVYDDIEAHLGIPINRLLVSEVLLRAEQSTVVVPAGRSWSALPEVLSRMLEQLYEVKRDPVKRDPVKRDPVKRHGTKQPKSSGGRKVRESAKTVRSRDD
jgi:AcrR family transcriptional regulator